MDKMKNVPMAYFPGCSLATSAKENNQSLMDSCRQLGYDLQTLNDWNCCGSSSAHSINPAVAWRLPARNLSLVPEGIPLLVACPSCMLRLVQTHQELKNDIEKQKEYEKLLGRPFDPDLKIIHFFELLDQATTAMESFAHSLGGMKIAPYYGCMLAAPPQVKVPDYFHGSIERVLSRFGGKPVRWPYPSRCCGTFLSAARPDVVEPLINEMMTSAVSVGADCLVTACAMCQLNLELRCTIKTPIPVFHFSELLALALGIKSRKEWFDRHLIDPRLLLKTYHLI